MNKKILERDEQIAMAIMEEFDAKDIDLSDGISALMQCMVSALVSNGMTEKEFLKLCEYQIVMFRRMKAMKNAE